MKYEQDFIDLLRKRTASSVIGASTFRSQGPPGTIPIARLFLYGEVDLAKLAATKDERQFKGMLNQYTKRLASRFQGEGNGNWGAARKAINLFFRDVVYNRFLCNYYGLSSIHKWLELPMDRHCYEGLKEDCKKIGQWPGIKHLSWTLHNEFQIIASELANKRGICRVDLDVWYWRKNAL